MVFRFPEYALLVDISFGIYLLNRFTAFCSFSEKYKGYMSATLLKINFTTVNISERNCRIFPRAFLDKLENVYI